MKYKIKKWIFNYLFYGYFISLIIINTHSFLIFKEFNFSLKILKGNFFVAFLVMPLSLRFKGLFKDFKELWTNGSIGQKVIIILGWIFLLYGFYSRVKSSYF